MEDVIKIWCDRNISINMAYRGDYPKDKPIAVSSLLKPARGRYDLEFENELSSIKERAGKLVYQDGAACSNYYAFIDIYLLDDGQYQIYIDEGTNVVSKIFKQLTHVVDYLASYSIPEGNSCKKFIDYLINKIKKKGINVKQNGLEPEKWDEHKELILSCCGDNSDLIGIIYAFGSRPYNPEYKILDTR